MSRRNKQKNRHRNFRSNKQSKETKNLERTTGHGFQEYNDVKEMHDFFTTDPDELPGAYYEPPGLRKPTRTSMARSEGKIQ